MRVAEALMEANEAKLEARKAQLALERHKFEVERRVLQLKRYTTTKMLDYDSYHKVYCRNFTSCLCGDTIKETVLQTVTNTFSDIDDSVQDI